jgi:hypothetical protein
MYGVLDLATGTVTMLEFEGVEPGSLSHRSLLFSASRGSRYQLFGDNLGREGFLVDLESGDTINLNDLLPQPAIFLTGAVSANDHWLLLADGTVSYLIDLTTLQPAIEVDSGRQARNVQFLADGESIVYARDAGEDGFEIVVQPLPSGSVTSVTPIGQWLEIRVLGENAIVAWQNGALFRVPVDGSGPQVILEASGELAPMSIDSSGQKVLVRRILRDQTSWFLVALDGSSIIALPELDGLQLMYPQVHANWAIFATAFGPQQGVPGTPYIGLDLQAGAVSTLLTQDETGIYLVSPSASPEGRFHLVQSIAPEHGRLWLLDAASGTGNLVAESGGNAVGVISPDGCYLAAGTFAALGEGREGQVEIHDLRSGEATAAIPDAVLLGWVS